MSKWLRLLIYVMVIGVAISVLGGIVLYNSTYLNVFNVGYNQVSVPEGYTIEGISAHGGIVKNQNTKILFYCADVTPDEDINQFVNNHKNEIISNGTEEISGINITKFIFANPVSGSDEIYLFFGKNDIAYHMTIQGDYDSTAVKTMIDSLK